MSRVQARIGGLLELARVILCSDYVALYPTPLILDAEHDHCAITDEELQRIWPIDEMDREKKIAQFAKNYGLHLTFYRQGMCAIFEIRAE